MNKFMSQNRAQRLVAGALLLILTSVPAGAQQERISTPIARSNRVAVTGNVHPKARAQFDRGPVEASMKLPYITLLLKRSPAQQAALDQLLVQQQESSSLNYHKWLTPEQYADRFGLNPGDIAKVTSWLESEGFTVLSVGRGRNWIAFSASAQQIQNALGTEIHRYQINGEAHFANATAPMIPAALEQVVEGFMGLDDFHPKPPQVRTRNVAPANLVPGPGFNLGGGNHALAPDDLATIYDLMPLYQSGIDGTGQRVAIAGESDISLNDIRLFRSTFQLPPNDPQLMLVPNTPDPGAFPGLMLEADLDIEMVGAVARKATIIYVYSFDAFTSAQYAIDQRLAPVLSFSFTLCELGLPPSLVSFVASLADQASVEGITWVASSGDSGPAGCDPQGTSTDTAASQGLAVGLPASYPSVTAVGGTQFDEGSGNYWAGSNTPSGGSAQTYIPEVVWNETGPQGLGASGGGPSALFPAPLWQASVAAAGAGRNVPDVSLAASAAHDGFLMVSGGPCCLIAGGTSASAQVFAGMVALINEFRAEHGLGNINPSLYHLAHSLPGAFHDITGGNNFVPCAGGSPGCTNGSFGYAAGPGYDLATGLGSVDADKMVTGWTAGGQGTLTVVTANPVSFAPGGSTQLTATVTAQDGVGVPTGMVAFAFGNTALGTAPLVTMGVSATATLTLQGSSLPLGPDTITATYAGTGQFNSSSGTVILDLTNATSSNVVALSVPNPVYEQPPDSSGLQLWFFTLELNETAGVPTTLTGLTFGGDDLSNQIVEFFGTSKIQGYGSIDAPLLDIGLPSVPATIPVVFSGRDASGRTWIQNLSLTFLGMHSPLALSPVQLNFSYSGASAPAPQTVNINTSGSALNWVAASNASWLGVTPRTGSTPGVISVSVNPAGLTPQTYHGTVTVSSDSVAPQTIFVTFTDTAPVAGLSLSASQLNFSYSGGSPPSAQTVNINSVGGNALNWTASSDSAWLGLSPASGTTPGTVSVTINLAGLTSAKPVSAAALKRAGSAGTAALKPSSPVSAAALRPATGPGVYQGTITISAPGFASQMISVTLNDTAPAGPVVSSVVNAASFLAGISAGALGTLFGSGLSPVNGIEMPGGATTYKGVSVMAGGILAPLFAVANVNGQEQINFQVPAELGVPGAVRVEVNNNGAVGGLDNVPVTLLQPGIFEYVPAGSALKYAAVIKTDGSTVGPANPAARGSTVSLFMTGLGPASPALSTGQAGPIPPATTTYEPVVGLNDAGVPVVFHGIAPGFIGLDQVNFEIPANTPTGPDIKLSVGIGGVFSQNSRIAVN